MKTKVRVVVLLLLVAFLMSFYSCQKRTCKYMKPYKNDVKRGIAR